jgi:hypothetical protein
MRSFHHVRAVGLFLLMVGISASALTLFNAFEITWQPVTLARLQVRVGDTDPNPVSSYQNKCCIYGTYSGCVYANPQLQCGDPDTRNCNAGQGFYGTCSDAVCNVKSGSTCGLQTGQRQVTRCVATGETTSAGCPEGQVRCDVTEYPRGSPGCGSVTVRICVQVPPFSLCTDGQPPYMCDL